MTTGLTGLSLLLVAFAALVSIAIVTIRSAIKARKDEEAVRADAKTDGAEDEDRSFEAVAGEHATALGLPIDPVGFLLLIVIIPVTVALGVLHLTDGMLSLATLALVLTIVGISMAGREVRRYRAWRFEEKLVDAVDLLAGALRGGESPIQALTTTAEACGQPVHREFKEVVRRLNLSMPIHRAVSRIASRYDSDSVRLFTNALVVKWSIGGDLAPVLVSIARMMRERHRHRLRVRTQLAGAWLTAILIAISPYILVLVFSWRFPEWLGGLLEHPAGPGLLFLAVCLQVIGFAWLHRIMRNVQC